MSDIRDNRLLEILVKILESYEAFSEKGAFDGDDGWSMLPNGNDINAAAVYLAKLDLEGDAVLIKKEYEQVQLRSMHHMLMLAAVGKTPEEQQATRERLGYFPLPSEDSEELKEDREVMGFSSSGAAVLATDRIRSLIQHVMELGEQDESIDGSGSPLVTTTRKKGVSLQDAALILVSEDSILAKELVKRLQNLRSPKLPDDIGFDPQHSQRKLYEPAALSDFLEKTESKSLCDERDLRKGLKQKARYPKEKLTLKKTR